MKKKRWCHWAINVEADDTYVALDRLDKQIRIVGSIPLKDGPLRDSENPAECHGKQNIDSERVVQWKYS